MIFSLIFIEIIFDNVAKSWHITNMTFETVLNREDAEGNEVEIPVSVECACHRAERGRRDRYGVQEEPDYDAEIEIESVTGADGTKYDLTPAETEAIEAEAAENASEN